MRNKKLIKNILISLIVFTFTFSTLLVNANAATPPSSADMSRFVKFNPQIQLGLQSCSACSVSFAKTIQEAVEIGWSTSTPDHVFSSSYIYNQLCGGINQGIPLTYALELVKNRGCTTTDLMPNDPLSLSQQPSAAANKKAGRFKEQGYNSVSSPASDDSITYMKNKLAGNVPLIASLKINKDFANLDRSNDTYDTFNPTDTYDYHAVCIVGYDDNKSGGAFKILNSHYWWGIDDSGFGWISYETYKKVVTDVYYLINKASQPDLITTFDQLKTGDFIAMHVSKYAPVANYVPDISWLIFGSTNIASQIFNPMTYTYKFDNYEKAIGNSQFIIEKLNPSGTANTYSDRQIRLKLPSCKNTGFTTSNLYFGYNKQSGKFEFTTNTSNLLNSGVWSLMGSGNGGFYLAIPQTNAVAKKLCLGANNSISLVAATAYGGDNFTIMKY